MPCQDEGGSAPCEQTRTGVSSRRASSSSREDEFCLPHHHAAMVGRGGTPPSRPQRTISSKSTNCHLKAGNKVSPEYDIMKSIRGYFPFSGALTLTSPLSTTGSIAGFSLTSLTKRIMDHGPTPLRVTRNDLLFSLGVNPLALRQELW
eukprot:scaffold1640_cov161-Amphora_coffeaeformis.AAC.9